MLVGYTRNMKN